MGIRRRNWYLEGWNREVILGENGKKRRVWSYTGDYYRFELTPRQLKRLKTVYAILLVVMLGVWFCFSLIRTTGREFFFVGAEWFLCIIPFMELILGVASFLPVKERMTYRAMFGCYKRCIYGTRILLVLFALAVVGEFVFLILYGGRIALWRELRWLVGVLCCMVCDLSFELLLRKYPPVLQ